MKYYLLNNSVVVFVDNKIHTISNNDYRFEQVKAAIANDNLEMVSSLIDPNYNLNKEGFIVMNGIVFYQNNPIPTVLGNRFIELHQDSFEFRSIFNFWHNMKARVDNDTAASIIGELVSKNAYAVTEDGFYLLYNNSETDQSKSVLNKRNQDEVFHFYNYAACPAKYFAYFESKKSLSTILEEVFGFATKKLRGLAMQRVFRTSENFVNHKFFFYGEAFKDVLANDNLFYAIENNLLDTNLGDVDNYQGLNKFLKDYASEKNGGYSQKKIINFLESAADKNKLVEIGTYYDLIKANIEIDIQSMNFVNDCETIHEFLKREHGRIKNPNFPLNNDGEIEALDNVEFDGFKIVVPKTNHDLIDWGIKMNHCVGTYGNTVKRKERQILGIADKRTDEMLYTADISRKNLAQLRGERNAAAPSDVHERFTAFLRDKGLIYRE